MNKRLLIISNDIPLAENLYDNLRREMKTGMEVSYEPNGSQAYSSIKGTDPDLLIVDIETPGLTSSWVSMQLDGVQITDQVPTIALSSLLNREEREVLTDMLEIPIYAKANQSEQLNNKIISCLH